MSPDDEGDGGGGTSDGGAAPATTEIQVEDHISFTALLERCPPLLLPGDEGGGGGRGGGMAASATEDPRDIFSSNGLEFFVDSQSGHILGTQYSWNQESQMESNMEEEEDVDSDCDNYDDFLVRCEGDTDVEDCFPIHNQEVVVDEVSSMAELQNKGRVKDAKYKAEKARKAKRRAIEGLAEDQGIVFSDQDSDDCKKLMDSSDDDHVVDGNDVSRTKRKSTATKEAKRAYYDESRLNEDYQFLPNM